MAAGDAAGDRQAQAAVPPLITAAPEPLEHLLVGVAGDARSRIDHLHRELSGAGVNLDADLTALGAMAQGVEQQVGK